MKKIFLFFLLYSGAACKKDREHCWDVFDALGSQIAKVCGKTEAEISAQYGRYYDRSDAKKYCWKIQYPGSATFAYAENFSEKMMGIYSAGAVSNEKVPCGYCQRWLSREKDLYKPTGSFIYQNIKTEQYCGDTCNTLFPGRIIILRDTPDSLITVEFLQKL